MRHFIHQAYSLPCALVLLSGGVGGSACASSAAELRGYPLYSSGTGARLPQGQVAKLSA
jgi:hypothetical protein